MNSDVLRYKKFFVTVVLIAGYIYLHSFLTGIVDFLPISKWLRSDVPLPFAQRMMIPVFTQGLQHVFPHFLQGYEWFFCFEVLFVSLLFVALYLLLKQALTKAQSLLACWVFFLILPLVYIINYRLSMGASAAFYTHYDIPTLFFSVAGFYLCLTSRWMLLYLCVFLATFNRESAVLLVLLVPVLYVRTFSTVVKPAMLTLLFFLLAKLIIHWSLQDQHGLWFELVDVHHRMTNFELNMRWLFSEQHQIFVLMFGFAGLPLLWFALYDFIPLQLRPLRYLLAAYFIGLLFVGKLTEPRIFGEIVVLMYYPVCLAVKTWIAGFPPFISDQTSLKSQPFWKSFDHVLYYCNRYAISSIFVLIVLFHGYIINFLNWMVDLK